MCEIKKYKKKKMKILVKTSKEFLSAVRLRVVNWFLPLFIRSLWPQH